MNRIDGGILARQTKRLKFKREFQSWTWRQSPNAKHLVLWQCSPRVQRHLSWFLLVSLWAKDIKILFIQLSKGLLRNGKQLLKALAFGFNLSEGYSLSLHNKPDNQLRLPHYPRYIRWAGDRIRPLHHYPCHRHFSPASILGSCSLLSPGHTSNTPELSSYDLPKWQIACCASLSHRVIFLWRRKHIRRMQGHRQMCPSGFALIETDAELPGKQWVKV